MTLIIEKKIEEEAQGSFRSQRYRHGPRSYLYHDRSGHGATDRDVNPPKIRFVVGVGDKGMLRVYASQGRLVNCVIAETLIIERGILKMPEKVTKSESVVEESPLDTVVATKRLVTGDLVTKKPRIEQMSVERLLN